MSKGILAAVAAAIVSTGCPAGAEKTPAAPVRALPAEAPMLPSGPGIAVQGPPGALRERLEGAYRLQLDRRFLRSVDALGALVPHGCATPAVATRAPDGWTLEACGEAVGTLPLDPDFPDAMALLAARAERLGSVQPVAAEPLTALPLLTPDDALVRLRRAGATRSRAAIHERAVSLANLTFALVDRMEVADELAAGALAAVALDRALGGADTARTEALLAAGLGYAGAARTIAAGLPDGDPLRVYLEGDDGALQKLGGGTRAEPAARLLWLRRLAEADASRVAREPLDVRAPLGAALARARARVFEVARLAGRDLSRAALSTGRGRGGKRRPERAASFRELEAVLDRAGPEEATFLRACFFDGIWMQADFALEIRSAPAEAEEVVRALGVAEPGTPEDGLQRYLAARVAAADRERDAAGLLGDLEAVPAIGGLPRAELYDAAAQRLEHGSPALIAGLRRLTPFLDGRPRHRTWLARFAWTWTSDPRLREDMLRGAARAGDPWARALVAKLDGDLEALRALAEDPREGVPTQALAVRLLAKEGVGDDELERRWRALLSTERDDWQERAALVELLDRRGRHEEAAALAREWLGRGHPAGGLRPVFARTALARALSRQGKDREALAVIAPAMRSWQGGALRRGGLVLAALGDGPRARSVADAVGERYPGVRGAAYQASILWRLGDHEAAAGVIGRLPDVRAIDWFTEIAPAFVEVLEDPAEALAAFEALRRAKLGGIELAEIASAEHRAGRDALAFDMASRLRHENPIGDLELAVTAYVFLDAVQGRDAARAWLDRRVPAPLRAPLSMFAFSRGRDELFWDLVPPPAGTSDQDDFTWLMFAASSLRAEPGREHAAALASRFVNDRPGFYHRLGRFLLGYEGPDRIIAAATGGKRACEASFYLGYKAERNGDCATAADWYRASVENGTPRDGEYRWAMERLASWGNEQLSLARLASRRRASASTPPRPSGSPPP